VTVLGLALNGGRARLRDRRRGARPLAGAHEADIDVEAGRQKVAEAIARIAA